MNGKKLHGKKILLLITLFFTIGLILTVYLYIFISPPSRFEQIEKKCVEYDRERASLINSGQYSFNHTALTSIYVDLPKVKFAKKVEMSEYNGMPCYWCTRFACDMVHMAAYGNVGVGSPLGGYDGRCITYGLTEKYCIEQNLSTYTGVLEQSAAYDVKRKTNDAVFHTIFFLWLDDSVGDLLDVDVKWEPTEERIVEMSLSEIFGIKKLVQEKNLTINFSIPRVGTHCLEFPLSLLSKNRATVRLSKGELINHSFDVVAESICEDLRALEKPKNEIILSADCRYSKNVPSAKVCFSTE